MFLIIYKLSYNHLQTAVELVVAVAVDLGVGVEVENPVPGG